MVASEDIGSIEGGLAELGTGGAGGEATGSAVASTSGSAVGAGELLSKQSGERGRGANSLSQSSSLPLRLLLPSLSFHDQHSSFAPITFLTTVPLATSASSPFCHEVSYFDVDCFLLRRTELVPLDLEVRVEGDPPPLHADLNEDGSLGVVAALFEDLRIESPAYDSDSSEEAGANLDHVLGNILRIDETTIDELRLRTSPAGSGKLIDPTGTWELRRVRGEWLWSLRRELGQVCLNDALPLSRSNLSLFAGERIAGTSCCSEQAASRHSHGSQDRHQDEQSALLFSRHPCGSLANLSPLF